MVIKDIEKPLENFKLLVEEPKFGNKKYEISYARAQIMEGTSIRISVSQVNENDSFNYQEIHGLELLKGKLHSYYLYEDKNRSSHDSGYLDDKYGYYDEIMGAFDELINSGLSEFTPKALRFLDEVRSYDNKIGCGKNAI